LMRFCRLMFLLTREVKIVQIFSILGGVLDQNVRFSTFDLENDGQVHIFSRSQYQKRVEDEALKIVRYHTHKSDVWCPVEKTISSLSANCILEITVKVMYFQGQNAIAV
jgi:hypothetical protein